MSLERQTVQLIYFLIDHVSLSNPPDWIKLELLVVSCIYLVLKLQGDITPSVLTFNDFVSKNLMIERGNLIKAEFAIISLIPTNFACLMTFSDFLCSCFDQLQSRLEPEYGLVTRACELCMGVYLFEDQPFEFATLAAAALLEAGRQNGFGEGMDGPKVAAFVQGEVGVDQEHLKYFMENFVDENRYAKDIFAKYH